MHPMGMAIGDFSGQMNSYTSLKRKLFGALGSSITTITTIQGDPNEQNNPIGTGSPSHFHHCSTTALPFGRRHIELMHVEIGKAMEVTIDQEDSLVGVTQRYPPSQPPPRNMAIIRP